MLKNQTSIGRETLGPKLIKQTAKHLKMTESGYCFNGGSNIIPQFSLEILQIQYWRFLLELLR